MWMLLSLLMPALIGCGRLGIHHGTEIGYRPPFIPVTFSFGTDGEISVSAGASITTPIGTFSLGENVSVPIGNGSTRLSIVHSVTGSEVKDVYDIAETGPMNACLDGHFFETIGNRETTITALDSVSTIRIIQGSSQCPAESPSSPAVPAAPQPATSPPVPASKVPVITSVTTYTKGVLVYFDIHYADPGHNAKGFGFVGASGSGWAEENHPFSNPSYGIVESGSIAYPFNEECGTPQQYESDVRSWIYDTAGQRSKPVVIDLVCAS